MKASGAANRHDIVVVRDAHRWRAYCPELEAQGASTWGRTRQEAVRHIREVLDIIAAEEPLPGELEAIREGAEEFARGGDAPARRRDPPARPTGSMSDGQYTASPLLQVRLCYNVIHMETEHAEMAKSAMMTVRLTPEVSEKLEALARDTKRSKSYLASAAIESYVDLNAWQVAHIKAALAEDEAGGPGVPHEEAMRWMESLGTDHELPQPEPKKS
jgi:predicted transcriptional regulator